jgi:hypothetical protein
MASSLVAATSASVIRKPYSKPTLVRGPVIAEVTAQTISGGKTAG